MTKNALVIGVKRTIITDFPDENIAVISDLQLINSLLLNNNWQEGNIKVLQNDQDVTKETVLNQMLQLANSVNSGDQMFLYFSGHGVEQSLQDTKVQSLVLYDTYLYDYEIRNVFRKANPASMLITVFDCCHSGSIIDFSPRINFPATIYFGACKDSQEAISYPSGSLLTSTIYSLKQQTPQITYSELRNQLIINIHEPEPVFTTYQVSNTYLEQNVAFF
jgi:Caspase domain